MLVTENIHKFGGKTYSSNCYVIEADEELILVDTGAPAFTEALLWEMKNARLDPDRITRVFNTHCHADHIGGNKSISEKFNPQFFAHRLDAVHVETADDYTAKRLMEGEVAGVHVTPVDDGFKIDGTGFKVLHTPGHTFGSICLYDPGMEILISGDTVFASGVGRTDLLGGNMLNLQASIDSLSKLAVRALLPGHGDYLEKTGDEAIKRAKELVGSVQSKL